MRNLKSVTAGNISILVDKRTLYDKSPLAKALRGTITVVVASLF